MAWIESHTVLKTHRKVLLLSRSLNLTIAQTIGHLHLLWHSALEQQENGDLSSWPEELIAEFSGYEGDPVQFVKKLQDFGWLDGKIIHDWWDYAGRYLQGKYSRNPEKWQAIKQLYTNSTQTAGKQHTIPNLPNLPNLPTKRNVHFSFDEIWSKYPNKVGRKAAEKHFEASVKTKEDFDKIKIALENYLKSERVQKGFIQNGSTWFNDWQGWFEQKPKSKWGL